MVNYDWRKNTKGDRDMKSIKFNGLRKLTPRISWRQKLKLTKKSA